MGEVASLGMGLLWLDAGGDLVIYTKGYERQRNMLFYNKSR